MEHPAWKTFLETNFPATRFEDPEYLTTNEVLQRLNDIAHGGYFMGSPIFQANHILELLISNGFKQLTPSPEGMCLWMIKNTSMPMITEEPENKEMPVEAAEELKTVQISR